MNVPDTNIIFKYRGAFLIRLTLLTSVFILGISDKTFPFRNRDILTPTEFWLHGVSLGPDSQDSVHWIMNHNSASEQLPGMLQRHVIDLLQES